MGVLEEFYLGTAAAVERHGIEPRVHSASPLADEETVLLRAGLVMELTNLDITKFGVVTGRGLADWLRVRDRLPLGVDVVVATDEDGRKPDPAPLSKVLRALGSGDFVMVGDTLSDLRMLNRHGQSAGDSRGIAVMVCPTEDEPTYRAEGAGWFVRSVDELPTVISRIRGRTSSDTYSPE